MNSLELDPVTGFLDAANWNSFTAEKKLTFLTLCEQYVKEHQKWPDLGSLCKAMNIDPRTLDNHLRRDAKFRDAYRAITLAGKWKLESLMYDLSAKSPLYMFGWLRKHYPEEYNPEHKITVSHATTAIDTLSTETEGIIDGELVDKQGEAGVSVP